MGVNVVVQDPIKVLKAFGIGQTTLNKLQSVGVTIDINSTLITFSYPQTNSIASVPIKSGVVSLAVAGDLGPASKQAIAYKIASAINKTISHIDKFDGSGSQDDPFTEKALPSKTLKHKLKEKLEANYDEGDNDPQAMKYEKSGVLKLKDATELYQSVGGTSPGAVYHSVAICTDLKIAARYKNKTLSVRFEGDIKKYKSNLVEAGIGVPNSKPYASMHLDIGDKVLAQKALGAIIVGLGVPFTTSVPVLDKFASNGV